MVDLVPQYRLGDGPGAGEAFRTAEEQSRQARLRAEQEARARFTAEQNAAYQQGQLSLAQQTAQRNAATAAYNRKRQAELDAYNRKRQEVLDQRAELLFQQQQEQHRRQQLSRNKSLAASQQPLPLIISQFPFPADRPGVRLPDIVPFTTPGATTPGGAPAATTAPQSGVGLRPSTPPGAPAQPSAAPGGVPTQPTPGARPTPPGAPAQPSAAPGGVQTQPTPGARPTPPGAPVQPSAAQPTPSTGTQIRTGLDVGGGTSPSSTLDALVAKYPELAEIPRIARTYISQNLKPVPEVVPSDAPVAAVRRSKQARYNARTGNIRTISRALYNAARAVTLNAATRRQLERKYNAAQIKEIESGLSQLMAAQVWYGTTRADKLFEANPELFAQVGRDPVAFYEQYKNASPSGGGPAQTPQAAAARLTDPNARLEFGTRAAVETAQAAVRPGPEAPPSRVVAAVTGARNPAKIQRIDVSFFRANPAALTYEVQQAEALYQLMDQRRRALLERHYTHGDVRDQDAAMDLRARMISQARLVFDAQGRAAVDQFELSGGADVVGLDRVASILYGRNVQHELTQDPQTRARVIRRYVDGKPFQENMKIKDLATEYRSRFDAAYKQSVAAAAKTRQEQIGKERLKRIEYEGKMTIEVFKQYQEGLRAEGFKKVSENPSDGSITLQGKRMYVDRYGIPQFETVLLQRNPTTGQVKATADLKPAMSVIGTTSSFGVPTTAPGR